MEILAYINISSIIGFFVIISILGFFLHLGLSKTGIYSRKVRAKGTLPKFVYICIFLVQLYIVLLIIFGTIKAIDF